MICSKQNFNAINSARFFGVFLIKKECFEKIFLEMKIVPIPAFLFFVETPSTKHKRYFSFELKDIKSFIFALVFDFSFKIILNLQKGFIKGFTWTVHFFVVFPVGDSKCFKRVGEKSLRLFRNKQKKADRILNFGGGKFHIDTQSLKFHMVRFKKIISSHMSGLKFLETKR